MSERGGGRTTRRDALAACAAIIVGRWDLYQLSLTWAVDTRERWLACDTAPECVECGATITADDADAYYDASENEPDEWHCHECNERWLQQEQRRRAQEGQPIPAGTEVPDDLTRAVEAIRTGAWDRYRRGIAHALTKRAEALRPHCDKCGGVVSEMVAHPGVDGQTRWLCVACRDVEQQAVEQYLQRQAEREERNDRMLLDLERLAMYIEGWRPQ